MRAICSTSGIPGVPGAFHKIPLWPRLRYTRLVFLLSASMSGSTSERSSLYEQCHSTMAPFLSASSGKPAPTFQSCRALSMTVSPASRAACTSSIQVFRVHKVEIRMDAGMSITEGRMAISPGDAVPALVWKTTEM